MSGLLNEIQRIVNDIRSEKAPTRNKAIEQFDQKLNSSKEALNTLLQNKKNELTWIAVFEASKEAVFKHVANLQDAREKTFKSLADKNYLYGNVLEKIINYNLEVGRTSSGHFLAKTTVFNAFEEFIKTRIVVKHFGDRTLNILDRGIYLSPSYVRELRVNEFSRILSYLFELNVENDEFLRSKLLKCITKTLQLAKDRVQIHNDLVEYLPGLAHFAQTAWNAERKLEIVRLYSIFVSELSVNYHHRLCLHIQEILPKLCEFHNEDVFRDDTRNVFFNSVINSLHSMYPKLSTCDFSTFQVPVSQSWSQTMLKLRTIVYMEIRTNSLQRYKTSQLNNDKFSELFIKMSAIIMFIVLWHIENSKDDGPSEDGEVPKKIARQNDKMDTIFNLIDKKEATFSDIWFAIFTELLQLSDSILNLANYQQALTITLEVLQMYGNAKNLKNIRLCVASLLKKERNWLKSQSITPNVFGELWTQITSSLLSDTTANGDEIREKQIILQLLIRHGKLDAKWVKNLLQTITSNEVLKRNECISTIREIFIHSRQCGLDKASSVELEPIVDWAYASGEKSSATQVIHNIAAIDAKLLADTFCISIINFLDEQQLQQLCNSNANAIEKNSGLDHKMLAYKYNRKFVCLNGDFVNNFKTKTNMPIETEGTGKNCLFQNNYELLMRTLNFENAKDNQPRAMLKNLISLHKLVCTMERLLNYKVFDEANFTSCPLIKRIGLFLSHIEFQYKANPPETIIDVDLRDILRMQIAVLDVFKSNPILISYLENQPIEMLIEFAGAALKQNSIKRERAENENCDTLTALSLQILSGLNAFNSHRDEAFEHLAKVTMRWQPKDVLIVIKMFCSCSTLPDTSCIWLVDKLKPVFQHHYQDLDIISEVVDHLPNIFCFVYHLENQLDDMFMALNSLLKIALKKSYASQLTAKILRCVGQIAQRCRNIWKMENFGVICKSTAKFITMLTLDVRYATLFTLTILLNTNCVASNAIIDTHEHWTFCEELYASIDFKKFSFTDEDVTQNSHSAMVQTLLAIFAFSSFHQEIALNQLLHFCALRKLSETDFGALNSLVPCHHQTLRDLLRTYANMMLHKWSSKGWAISKFPYFLCYTTKADFLKANATNIMAYTLLYFKPEDVQRYRKIIREEEALPLIAAYVMPESSDCDESQSPGYREHQRNLTNNLNELKLNAKDVACNATTIYKLISLLFDAPEMGKLFGDSVPWIRHREWYNLTADSFFKSLDYHIHSKSNSFNNNSQEHRVHVMGTLQIEHSLVLVELFGILKTHCYTAVFSSHALHSLFHYCVIANAVYDSARMLEEKTTKDNGSHVHSSYFVRDIWFFLTRFLKHNQNPRIQITTLDFLNLLLEKPKFQSERFASHMDEIAKLLVTFLIQTKRIDVKDKAVATLERILKAYKMQINMQSLLEESTECEFLKSLREQFEASLPKSDKENVANYLQSFLTKTSVDRLHDLRDYIAEYKNKLQTHESVLFELINRLLRLARDCHNKKTSLDALKCLAEIGPINLKHFSYYFQTEFDALKESEKVPMEQFLTIICEFLENYLFQFDPNTQEPLITVAKNVINSKVATRIKSSYSNLQIFVIKFKNASCLNKQIMTINWLAVLQDTEHLSYEAWICAFMANVFKGCGWQGFDDLAARSFSFAEVCLQPFVRLLLENRDQHMDSLCQMLDYFFQSFVNKQSENVIFQEKRVIKKLLNICECIRTTNNWCVPIDLSNVVLASNHCQAYFLSVMYLELWACSGNEKTTVEILADESFQACAKKSYESIGCLDAIPGFLNPLICRVDFHSHDNNLSGILLESGDFHGQLCLDVLKSNGMWSWAHLQQHHNPDVERDYEIFWRLGQWEELVDHYKNLDDVGRASINLEQEFKKYHYLALKSINNREEENSRAAIENAYQCILEILKDFSMECLQIVYKYLTWLCTLTQAEDFCQIQFGSQVCPASLNQLFNKWQMELNLKCGNFACKEFTISHQIALFKMAGTRASRRMQGFYGEDPIDMYLLKGIAECKSAGRLNLASKYIAMLRDLPGIKESTKIGMLLEDADVNIRTGNHRIAKAILNHIATNNEFNYCVQRVSALRMQGEFLMDSNAESFSSVLRQKFNGSLKLLNHFVEHKDTLQQKFPQIFKWQEFSTFENLNRKAAHAVIAKYADREYQQLHDYRQSQDYYTLLEIIGENRQVADKVTTREDRDSRISAAHMKGFAMLDEKELQRIDDNLTEHLCTAVLNYMTYCKLDSGLSSAAVYRIISLWFTNARNMVLLSKIESEIQSVPSYKFICAVNQLIGRLNSKNQELLKILVELLVRCGQEHPHHTFYQLYPLVFAKLDGVNSNTEREGIATKIIAKICEKNPNVLETRKQLESMFPVLIAYANHDTESKNNKPTAKSITDRNKLRDYILRLKKLDSVHCPTLELPVLPSKDYNITSIVKWTNEFSACGGLNAPTKVICLCSDGQMRPQLIKGKDDLRQDAVMQQVFGIVNELLQQDSEFIERNLHVRTYKVTPLSMRSGILEWCSNSMPVGRYLVGDGKGGAHMQYRPNDWTNNKCRSLSHSHLRSPREKRFEIYKQICEHVKPVFHYFLLEKFLIPGIWFERRLAYTNSVATTSIVGYILGLGDRHTQNILIDEQTAEVIHIDFGIAFEQGKIQVTPETVPFRLTRDFVAPMGVCGTNGVFTKSCEATMRILRRYKSVLITILEVLLYDPLFIWGVLSKKKSNKPAEQESVNLVAQRALLLVQNKLEGREAGTLGNSNVEAQVERLINEATLPSNLCMLFPGWDPYL